MNTNQTMLEQQEEAEKARTDKERDKEFIEDCCNAVCSFAVILVCGTIAAWLIGFWVALAFNTCHWWLVK
jgi:hypothetical protein